METVNKEEVKTSEDIFFARLHTEHTVGFQRREVINAMEEYASLKSSLKDKRIEELEKLVHIPEYVFDSIEVKNPFDYFHNEKGDYTITMHDRPIAFVKNEADGVSIKNSFNALTMRVDVQKKQIQASIVRDKNQQSRIEELTKALEVAQTEVKQLYSMMGVTGRKYVLQTIQQALNSKA
jgi:GTPase involved in cell partitioning and DNA repair